jgi:serine/threonine protein kinase
MALPAGTKLGPYEILGALGAGGMGEVYKARDTRLERTVAIKIMPAALAGDPEFAERFEREARVISSLDHPNICALYDVGTTPEAGDGNDPSKPIPGVSFLVMQYLDGRTLAEHLRRGPLPIAQALRLAIEMADALDHAHRSGIVHRDLKPANVMLTGPGATRSAPPSKLLDFGLAKLRQTPATVGLSGPTQMAAQPVTARGTILGTVQYMSPEQVEGRETDARTDLFALGAILYEMVTGARPFAGSTPSGIMSELLRDTPPPVTTRQPLAPPALDHLISTCLAKDPDDRWQSAGDVKRELLWIQSTLSASGSAPSAGARVRTGKSRGQATTVGDYVNFRLSPDGKQVAFTRVDLQTHTSDIWLLDLARGGIETRFTSHPATDTAPIWSPDGSQILFRSDRAGGNFPFVKPVSGAESERQLQVKFNMSFPADWSPDGRFIAFHGSATLGSYDVTVIDWPSGTKPTPFADSPFTEMDSHFSPDGRWLAYASDVSARMEVYVQAFPKSGNVIRVSSNGGSEPHWRRDGRELFFIGADRMVMAVPVVLGTSFQAGSPVALFQKGGRSSARRTASTTMSLQTAACS